MSQRVVAFTGISGVGKTTFLRKFAELMEFQHVTGGSLIAAAKNVARDARDDLRHADLDENQRLLIEGFTVARDANAEVIILDGHVVIDDGERPTKISSDVFKALGVMAMVHLETDPKRIAKNRSKDSARSRPRYDTDILRQHQDMSRQNAHSIAEELGISFYIVTHNDVAHLASLLEGAPLD
ncbi:AAA family ATPase [Phaeobacter sp. C3_T13_0]|uniref:AAA family ATPase n=1 Tax=Phaeobacter cretensis TaxID=3342641 RepID=UPI0039BC9483